MRGADTIHIRCAVSAVLLSLVLNATCIKAFLNKGAPFIHSRFRDDRLFAVMTRASIVMNDTPLKDANQAFPFNSAEWQEYEATVRAVMENGRLVKRKDKSEDVERAIDYLLCNRSILPSPPIMCVPDSRESMMEQKVDFLSKANLTETQHEFAMRTLTYLGDHCAKKQMPNPLLVAWHKLKESGMVPRENCISTYMYVLSLDSSSSDIATEVANFHDLFYEPNEKTITLRIKSMIANENAAGAEELLQGSVGNGEWKKLRTYVPLLEMYCRQGDMTSALHLYRRMQEQSRVYFEPETYALLIGTLAEQGWFRRDSRPISGIQELGFSNANGPGLFDELAAEMAADILELNNPSSRILYNGFIKGFSSGNPVADDEEIVVNNAPANEDKLAIGRVSLNNNTAICPKTGAKLQLFQLDDEQRRSVHDTLLEMAGIQYEKFMHELEARFKNKMAALESSDFAVRELRRFSDWLIERQGKPFTAIVDGPNVAYFGHGNVHYSQVKKVVDELERMNERPLVVMPQKYTATRFNVNYSSTQELTDRDLAVLKELNETGKLYTVPSKCLDDYYWMLASISNQSTASDDYDYDMNVPISDSDGRFPGLRPMLVTNDQMRDHRWDLLEPRLFRRWCSCHIVNYNFTEFVEDEWADDRRIDLCAADFFSNEIQGNPTPGNEVGSSRNVAWHFPVDGWDEHDRLCIRLPL